MYGIFVYEPGGIHYASALANGIKPVETRTRNMLKQLIGKRVAIISTRRNRKPVVVGYATIDKAVKEDREWLDGHRDLTLIPEGSQFDCAGKFKWCYWLSSAETCEPYQLPASAVRHGRSWCEFQTLEEIMTDCTGECDSCPHRKRVPGDIDRIDREPQYFCDYQEL